MESKSITDTFAVAGQILPDDLAALKAAGVRSVICNRPDREDADQPTFAEIEAAARQVGLEARHVPVLPGQITDADVAAFAEAMKALPKPVLGFCRSGLRAATLWALLEGTRGTPLPEILRATRGAGHDIGPATRRILAGGRMPREAPDAHHRVVIVGGGAAGIAVASSLKARKPDLDVAIIEPADVHYYQPGWTLVGAGVFRLADTVRTMASVIPTGVAWIKAAVAAFEPNAKRVLLKDGGAIAYDRLIVAPGLTLDWAGIEGLTETLGRNGVTSNYRSDLAPYTWHLVQGMTRGRALFTQPPMPIKCAGAPQKAMYLSADHWRRHGRLDAIGIGFFNAGRALFGVEDYVAPLMSYVERYRAKLNFGHDLTRIDGASRRAWFTKTGPGDVTEIVETAFDMIHVTPPQRPPDFIRVSPLADPQGWVEVDAASLRHKRFSDIFGLGDACSAPNAKTAAAARKQAPVVAHNLLRDMGLIGAPEVVYDGYGSCPLTVEKGKILLAEFGYGGALLPSFPAWFIDGTKPSRAAWFLKRRLLPPLYWAAMLKGREWLASPRR